MGLEMLVKPEHRLPTLNTIRVPEGVDEAKVRGYLLETFNLEIGAGLGALAGQVWRVGLMGYSSSLAGWSVFSRSEKPSIFSPTSLMVVILVA